VTINRSLRLVGRSVVLLSALVFSSLPAQGDPVRITVAGASFGAENDSVVLLPTTFNLPGDPFSSPVRFDLQQGEFQVGLSPSQSPPHPLTLSRLITIDGLSRTVTQNGSLSITPTVDTLTIFDSPSIAFDFGTRGRLFLTLDGLTRSTTVVGNFPLTIAGTLSTTAPVPEPATLALFGAGIAVLVRRLRLRGRTSEGVSPNIAEVAGRRHMDRLSGSPST
jgi:hypothetical protein